MEASNGGLTQWIKVSQKNQVFKGVSILHPILNLKQFVNQFYSSQKPVTW